MKSLAKLATATIIMLTLVTSIPVLGQEGQISVILDGQAIALEQPPIMQTGRVMVPLRGIFERLGADVSYDSDTRTIVASKLGTQVLLSLDSPQATVNDQIKTLDAPPLVINGRVLVPLRFVSEALGAEVRWTAFNQQVNILSRTGGANLPLPPSTQIPSSIPNPRIDSITISPGQASVGDSVTVDVDGTPGNTAMVSIGPDQNMLMREVTPGHYQTTYTVPSKLSGQKADVNVRLQSPNGLTDTRFQANVLNIGDGSSSIGPLPFQVMAPNPAAQVRQVFDVNGVTSPNALVRMRVTAEKAFIGMVFGSRYDEIVSTQTVADANGYFHFRVDTGNLGSGTHIVVTMHSETPTGNRMSNELRLELTRQ